MKRYILLLAAALAVGAAAAAQSADAAAGRPAAAGPARVFALNLWSEPVDIQLGAAGAYSVEGLKPAAPATLQAVAAGGYGLYYKPSRQAAWRQSRDGAGGWAHYDLQPNATYLVRVAADGQVDVFEMAAGPAGKAHLAFFNASGRTLDEMAVLPDAARAALRATAVPDMAFTDFAELAPGRFAGKWVDQGEGRYVATGKAVDLLALRADAWYCFVVGVERRGDGTAAAQGRFWDVSPVAPAADR